MATGFRVLFLNLLLVSGLVGSALMAVPAGLKVELEIDEKKQFFNFEDLRYEMAEWLKRVLAGQSIDDNHYSALYFNDDRSITIENPKFRFEGGAKTEYLPYLGAFTSYDRFNNEPLINAVTVPEVEHHRDGICRLFGLNKFKHYEPNGEKTAKRFVLLGELGRLAKVMSEETPLPAAYRVTCSPFDLLDVYELDNYLIRITGIAGKHIEVKNAQNKPTKIPVIDLIKEYHKLIGSAIQAGHIKDTYFSGLTFNTDGSSNFSSPRRYYAGKYELFSTSLANTACMNMGLFKATQLIETTQSQSRIHYHDAWNDDTKVREEIEIPNDFILKVVSGKKKPSAIKKVICHSRD